MDLQQFALKMDLRASKIAPNLNEVKKRVATEILGKVVARTPVDTGEAISNWIVGIGSSAASPRPAHMLGKGGSTYDQNVRATITAGEKVIASAKSGQEIHISTALDYVKKLNDGSSTQAPSGFVELAVLDGISLVRTAKLID